MGWQIFFTKVYGMSHDENRWTEKPVIFVDWLGFLPNQTNPVRCDSFGPEFMKPRHGIPKMVSRIYITIIYYRTIFLIIPYQSLIKGSEWALTHSPLSLLQIYRPLRLVAIFQDRPYGCRLPLLTPPITAIWRSIHP